MARDSVMGRLGRGALDRLEEVIGGPVEVAGRELVESDHLRLLEATFEDHRILNRELEMIGYTILDYVGGQPQELSQPSRRRIVQRARNVWMNDPQAGAAVELMNDFCFGRGVPKPRCKDDLVQQIVDEAWDDPDNQEVLTSLEAQLALGTDLSLQSNVFPLLFDEEPGTPKLSLLRHDDVETVVTDPDRRHRILWYVARSRRQEWDFKTDRMKMADLRSVTKPLYYAHWRNVELADEETRETPVDRPDSSKIGKGKVYHVRINRYTEQHFGTPRFQRTLRWYTAYNDFVKARIDVAQAAAAFIMKRKIKGTPQQLARDASRFLSRQSPLAGAQSPDAPLAGVRPGSIIEENDSVSHESLRLDTGSGNAQEDANMIRAPISAAERWSQAYFGDQSSSSLATATSLELPILKAVESRQEVFEGLFRWFIDRVIEKAVDDGRIPSEGDEAEEPASVPATTVTPGDQQALVQQALVEAATAEIVEGRSVIEIGRIHAFGGIQPLLISRDGDGLYHYRLVDVREAHEQKGTDEDSTERDLGYEFSMPSPLRRMMTDLIAAITQIAGTFDPNNTNVELSRALLTIALGEGLEVQDPADLVDKVLPEGYVDPAIAAAQAAQGLAPDGTPLPGFSPNGDTAFPSGADSNAYGGPMNSTRPEDQRSGAYNAQEAVTVGRDGREVTWPAPKALPPAEVVDVEVLDEHFDDLPEPARRQAEGQRDSAARMFREDLADVVLDALDRERLAPTGG